MTKAVMTGGCHMKPDKMGSTFRIDEGFDLIGAFAWPAVD